MTVDSTIHHLDISPPRLEKSAATAPSHVTVPNQGNGDATSRLNTMAAEEVETSLTGELHSLTQTHKESSPSHNMSEAHQDLPHRANHVHPEFTDREPTDLSHVLSNETSSDAEGAPDNATAVDQKDSQDDSKRIPQSADHTVYDEDVDPLFSQPSPRSHPRPQVLELNLKPPSPQPWDLVDPPFELTRKGPGLSVPEPAGSYRSPAASQKFSVMQSASGCVFEDLDCVIYLFWAERFQLQVFLWVLKGLKALLHSESEQDGRSWFPNS